MDEYQLEFAADIGYLHKNCPACGKEMVPQHQECLACGVVVGRFEKRTEYLRLKSEIPGLHHLNPQQMTELEQKWRLVVVNYHDQLEHMAFIRLCQKHEALLFAIHHYGEILRMHRDDDIALMMQKRALSFLQSQAQTVKEPRIGGQVRRGVQTLIKWFNWIGLFVSSFCVVVGLSVPDQKNLIGLGVTLLVLFTSLSIYRRY